VCVCVCVCSDTGLGDLVLKANLPELSGFFSVNFFEFGSFFIIFTKITMFSVE
jgi:hypothetical protein